MNVKLDPLYNHVSVSTCSKIGVEDERLEAEVYTSRIYKDAVDCQEVIDDPSLA
jgi:hypothetical protein